MIQIMSHPERLSARFKLVAERARLAEERKAIRLKLTLAIIEEVLNDSSRAN